MAPETRGVEFSRYANASERILSSMRPGMLKMRGFLGRSKIREIEDTEFNLRPERLIVATATQAKRNRLGNNYDAAYQNRVIGEGMIADGMGDNPNAGWASKVAVVYIADYTSNRIPVIGESARDVERGLYDAIEDAHYKLVGENAKLPKELRAGSTALVYRVVGDKKLVYAHSGDSSLKVLRAGKIIHVTREHTIQRHAFEGNYAKLYRLPQNMAEFIEAAENQGLNVEIKYERNDAGQDIPYAEVTFRDRKGKNILREIDEILTQTDYSPEQLNNQLRITMDFKTILNAFYRNRNETTGGIGLENGPALIDSGIFTLQPGDLIAAGSDGVFDNVKGDILASMLKKRVTEKIQAINLQDPARIKEVKERILVEAAHYIVDDVHRLGPKYDDATLSLALAA